VAAGAAGALTLRPSAPTVRLTPAKAEANTVPTVAAVDGTGARAAFTIAGADGGTVEVLVVFGTELIGAVFTGAVLFTGALTVAGLVVVLAVVLAAGFTTAVVNLTAFVAGAVVVVGFEAT